jgi:hypothetical protein
MAARIVVLGGGFGGLQVPLLERVRSEFLEMPGLRLTSGQAARLWATDLATSERILNRLVEVGFLERGKRGTYLLASVV